ncbi:MAG: hypothetical protein LBN39_08720, partial [Planctomycetaceae bacterium]|nr:hypothetical protein [Planctomycetaceae bacterium]
MFLWKKIVFSFLLCITAAVQLNGQDITAGYSAETKKRGEIRTNRKTAVQNYERDFRDAVQSIPWSSLPPKAKEKIKSVVLKPSLFRKMPRQAVFADSEMYQFLTEHPDIVVGFWDVLGATELTLNEIRQNQFLMKENDGTVAVAEVLYRTTDVCIVYAKGQYRAPFLVRP